MIRRLNKTKLVVIVGILVAILIALIVAFSVREGEQVITIGAILHLTGDQSEPAQAFLEGIELAVDEINANGGVLNKEIKLVVEDDNLKPERANTVAVKLINVDGIAAGVDASFLEAMANGPAFEQAKIPVITLWDSAEDIENLGEYVFGIGIWTPSAAEKSAEFAYENLDLRTIVIINTQNEWSQAVSGMFKNRFENLGGKIVNTYSIAPSDSADFRTVIAKVLKDNPGGIYSPVTDGVTIFYKQLRELGFDGQVITSDIITENHIGVLGEGAEGIYQTQASDPFGEKTEQMKQLYLKKYGNAPKQTLFIAWGYDAVYMIKEAIESGNSFEPEDIKNNLYELEVEGASGYIDIDENGSRRTLESVYQIQDGQFILVEK